VVSLDEAVNYRQHTPTSRSRSPAKVVDTIKKLGPRDIGRVDYNPPEFTLENPEPIDPKNINSFLEAKPLFVPTKDRRARAKSAMLLKQSRKQGPREIGRNRHFNSPSDQEYDSQDSANDFLQERRRAYSLTPRPRKLNNDFSAPFPLSKSSQDNINKPSLIQSSTNPSLTQSSTNPSLAPIIQSESEDMSTKSPNDKKSKNNKNNSKNNEKKNPTKNLPLI